MAKRKTKSGKQKQTKKKTGSILGKNGSKRKIGSANGNGNRTNDIRILCSLPKPRVNKQQHLYYNHGLHPPSLQQSLNNNKNEKADFDRQMNSLVERSKAVDASTNRKKSGRRRKHPESKLLKHAMMLKPASFSLEKSTNQLMEETMHQMGQIMSSNNHLLSALPPATNGSSSLARAAAAIPSSERTPIISNASHRTSFSSNSNNITGIAGIGNNQKQNKNQQQNRNSFSALDMGNSSDEDNDDDDDNDNNNESNAEIARANTIRFAPAAFSLQDSSRASSSTPSLLLPTKTPPTTPSSTPNQHFMRVNKRATSLFATINEEEIEELHYQRQMGKADANHPGAIDPHFVARHLENIQQSIAGGDDVDEDL